MGRSISKNGVTFQVENSDSDWDLFENNSWEPTTFKILDKMLKSEFTMVDAGTWIGPISLYSAHKVSRCYSFEPDPVAYKEFSRNVLLNPHLAAKIEAINKAITADGKPVRLFTRFNYGDSGSSILKRVKSSNQFVDVDSVIFENFLQEKKIPRVHFIKMDIEGGEFFVLPQMTDYLKREKPGMLVSLHFSSLCEYLELKYFPWGILRRAYRLLDRKNSFLKRATNRKIQEVISALSFYHIYHEDFTLIRDTTISYENVDMLIFSAEEIK